MRRSLRPRRISGRVFRLNPAIVTSINKSNLTVRNTVYLGDEEAQPTFHPQHAVASGDELYIYTRSTPGAAVVKLNMSDYSQNQTQWIREFPIGYENSPSLSSPQFSLGGILLKNNGNNSSSPFLIVAGSTRGVGEGYGSAVGDDEDGYIALLDVSTGALLTNRKSSERFGTADDDVVGGVCEDPNDDDIVYIVGETQGDLGAIPADSVPLRCASMVSASETSKGSVGQLSAKSGSVNIFSILPSFTSME